MGIDGLPSLGIPLNLEEPAYLVRAFSFFLFYLRSYEQNWTLCIGSLQLLNSLLYWYPGTIQSLSYFYQVNELVLAYGSVNDQVPKDPSPYLYNTTHKAEYFCLITLPHSLTILQPPCYILLSLELGLLLFLSLELNIYLCILLFLLLIKETAIRLTPSWRQSLFQILIKMPRVLYFAFH